MVYYQQTKLSENFQKTLPCVSEDLVTSIVHYETLSPAHFWFFPFLVLIRSFCSLVTSFSTSCSLSSQIL